MSDHDLQQAKNNALEKSIELGVLNALITIASNGVANSYEELCLQKQNYGLSRDWEKCKVILHYKDWYKDKKDWIEGTLYLEDEIIYKTDGSAFRMGAWVDRFVTYSKKVRSEYEKQQQEKIQQERSEALKPFSDIDF